MRGRIFDPPQLPNVGSAYVTGVFQGGPMLWIMKQVFTPALGAKDARFFSLCMVAWLNLSMALSVLKRTRQENPARLPELKSNLSVLMDTALFTAFLCDTLEPYTYPWVGPLAMLLGWSVADQAAERILPQGMYNHLHSWWNRPVQEPEGNREPEVGAHLQPD